MTNCGTIRKTDLDSTAEFSYQPCGRCDFALAAVAPDGATYCTLCGTTVDLPADLPVVPTALTSPDAMPTELRDSDSLSGSVPELSLGPETVATDDIVDVEFSESVATEMKTPLIAPRCPVEPEWEVEERVVLEEAPTILEFDGLLIGKCGRRRFVEQGRLELPGEGGSGISVLGAPGGKMMLMVRRGKTLIVLAESLARAHLDSEA